MDRANEYLSNVSRLCSWASSRRARQGTMRRTPAASFRSKLTISRAAKADWCKAGMELTVNEENEKKEQEEYTKKMEYVQ